MDFIRDILFGDSDSPELMKGNKCPDLTTGVLKEEGEDSPPNTSAADEGIKEQLLESLQKYKKSTMREGWREKYHRLKRQEGEELDETSNSNKTGEKKAEELFYKHERNFTRLYNLLSSDWKQYDRALAEFTDKLTSVEIEDSTVKEEEEEILHLTDFLNIQSEVSDSEQDRTDFNESQELGMHINQVDSLESELRQMDEDSLKLVEENEALKLKQRELEREKEEIVLKIDQDRKRFIQQVDDVLNVEMSRIRTNFNKLKKENEMKVEENEQLKRKVEENDKQIFSLYEKRDEDHEHYRTLLVEKHKLYAQKKLVKSKFKSLERKNKNLSKECEELSVKLEKRLAQNQVQHKEYEEKLSCFLKNMDMFKVATEKRLETKVKRLEDRNLKLSKDNHDLRCTILDKSLHGIMTKPETKSPQSPQ